jgi:alcohol dehydrogenase (cytochrome c)
MRRITTLLVTAAALGAGTATVLAQDAAAVRDYTPITDEILRNPDPNDWVMMRGNYEMWGYSELDQINKDNVGQLTLAWARAMGDGPNQGAPLVYDGIMFLPGGYDRVQAIDARTGDLIWDYQRERLARSWTEGPIRQNHGDRKRSVFLYEDKVLMVTDDNTVVALDARSGQIVWETNRGGDGYATNSNGPIVVDGVVIAGSSCQVAPFGCYVTGHDVNTGEELWRNEVIPRPGQPGDETWGGTPFESRYCTGVWGQIGYDPELNLVNYGSTGICPASEAQRGQIGATMAGTNERWAVRPDTGEVVWRRQLLPRDNWDQECTFEMMALDTAVNPSANAEAMLAFNPAVAGQDRRILVGMPCKNPVFWALDAATGEFIYAKATWDNAQNLYASIDQNGVPTMNEEAILGDLTTERFMCTTFNGGRDWFSGSYDPVRNVMYQATADRCTYLSPRTDREPTPQFSYNVNSRQVLNPFKDNDLVGRLDAVNVETGETVWIWETRAGNYSPTLSTGGGLLWNSGGDRYFRAHDADTGEILWQTRLGSSGSGFTSTYSLDGRQYVATVAGNTTRNTLAVTPEVDMIFESNMVYVFALPQ